MLIRCAPAQLRADLHVGVHEPDHIRHHEQSVPTGVPQRPLLQVVRPPLRQQHRQQSRRLVIVLTPPPTDAPPSPQKAAVICQLNYKLRI